MQIRPLHYWQAWNAPLGCFKPMYKAGWYYTHDKYWGIRRTTENTWTVCATPNLVEDEPQLNAVFTKYGPWADYYPTREDAIKALEIFLTAEGVDWH